MTIEAAVVETLNPIYTIKYWDVMDRNDTYSHPCERLEGEISGDNFWDLIKKIAEDFSEHISLWFTGNAKGYVGLEIFRVGHIRVNGIEYKESEPLDVTSLLPDVHASVWELGKVYWEEKQQKKIAKEQEAAKESRRQQYECLKREFESS